MNNVAGCRAARGCAANAASQPSITRWSNDNRFIIWRGTTAPSANTGTVRIHADDRNFGIVDHRRADKSAQRAKLDTVIVDPDSSSRVAVTSPYRAHSRAISPTICQTSRVCAS